MDERGEEERGVERGEGEREVEREEEESGGDSATEGDGQLNNRTG